MRNWSKRLESYRKNFQSSNQREKAFKESESYYRAFFERGTDGVVIEALRKSEEQFRRLFKYHFSSHVGIQPEDGKHY